MVEANNTSAGGKASGRAPVQTPPGEPSYTTFKELMDDSLNKIIKTVSKSKNKDLIQLCQQALEQVAADQNEEKWSANKYFYIFKMAIECRISRLVEQLLYRIQKLFSYDFLNGDCADNCRYEEG